MDADEVVRGLVDVEGGVAVVVVAEAGCRSFDVGRSCVAWDAGGRPAFTGACLVIWSLGAVHVGLCPSKTLCGIYIVVIVGEVGFAEKITIYRCAHILYLLQSEVPAPKAM